MPEDDQWTPYPHEPVRVSLLWRKRLILGLLIGGLFAFWAASLGADLEFDSEVDIIGEDGDTVQVEQSEEDEEPLATVTLSPGETATMDDDLELGDADAPVAPTGPLIPERPPGIPFLGLLLLLGPFLAALSAWRYLQDQSTSTEANYGIYKGALPLEAITAQHAGLVRTGREVEDNPFGKRRNDYLRDALNDPAREHGLRLGRRGPHAAR